MTHQHNVDIHLPGAVDVRALAVPGTYALLFHLHRPLLAVEAGRLGTFDLAAGTWIYCGSAWGPGGLRARLLRHVRRDKKPHWHIDAISSRVSPAALLVAGHLRMECAWVQALLQTWDIQSPIRSFGNSDCRTCHSHLLFTAQRRTPDSVRELLLAITGKSSAT